MFRFYRSTTSRTAGLHGAALLIPRAVTGWLFVLHGLYKFGLHTGVLGPNGVGGAEIDFTYLVVGLLVFAAGPGALALSGAFRKVRPRL